MNKKHDVVEPKDSLPPVELADLSPVMQDACKRAGWPSLMPVQSKAIPYLLKGRDLMVQSRTGSGKTGAFVLPMIDEIDPDGPTAQALVLVPTRELARQVAADAKTLMGTEGIRTIAVYGGVGYGPQIKAFKEGAQLVVGTPGRILDHLIRGVLSLDKLKILIFDEADRMLSMGFFPDMQEVRKYLPRHRINVCMFSATFPPHVMRLARTFMHEPDMLSLSRDHVHVAETEHVYYEVPRMEKDRALVRIVEAENPPSAFIFCNTKARVEFVTTLLQRFGYDADLLTADLSQGRREKVLQKVRKGKLRFLVATDLAARGIDVPELSHVIQYEPPEDPEAYVHRAGRTGRAGASGEAITLVEGQERTQLKTLAKRYDIDMVERKAPTDEDVQNIVAQRLIALLEAKLRSRDRVQVERIGRFVPLAKMLAEAEDEASVIAMLLDDYYQQSLHSPIAGVEPDQTDKQSPPPSQSKKKKRRRGGGKQGGKR